MSELLPCPFCGGEAQVQHQSRELYGDVVDWYGVYCKKQFCGYVSGQSTEAEAIAAWNSRAKPPCGGGYCPLCGAAERTCRNLDKHHNIMFKCSECGHWECQDFDGEKILPQTWNYCPNCGCKVVGE